MNHRIAIYIFSLLIAAPEMAFSADYKFADFVAPAGKSFRVFVSNKTVDELRSIEKTNGLTAYDYLKRKPNYAGHYEVVEWGCGTPCFQAAIIDLVSGEIVDYITSCSGLIYKIDSLLLVEDGHEDDPMVECRKKRYYVLENGRVVDLK